MSVPLHLSARVRVSLTASLPHTHTANVGISPRPNSHTGSKAIRQRALTLSPLLAVRHSECQAYVCEYSLRPSIPHSEIVYHNAEVGAFSICRYPNLGPGEEGRGGGPTKRKLAKILSFAKSHFPKIFF